MTTILLVRHGETDWNTERRWQGHADQPLNAAGRAQALELAAALIDRGVDVVYASDLSRAHETAMIVAEQLGRSVLIDPRLREVDVGDSVRPGPQARSRQTDPDGVGRFEQGLQAWKAAARATSRWANASSKPSSISPPAIRARRC